MSFTQSELQSFSLLLDQKLAQQKRELERSFDQRMHLFRRDMEQRLSYMQQEVTRTLAQNLAEQQRKLRETLVQRLDTHHPSSATNGTGMKQQIEETIEQALDTQLVSLDQLISQRFAAVDEPPSLVVDDADFTGIEVQAEIPWDELAEAVNKALDERFVSLQETLRSAVRAIEQYLAERLSQLPVQRYANADFEAPIVSSNVSDKGTISTMQDVFASIERLEHIIESMQVTMTSNHALLSNRIYHHQQLPLERAHVRGQEVLPQNVPTTKGLHPVQKETETDTQ